MLIVTLILDTNVRYRYFPENRCVAADFITKTIHLTGSHSNFERLSKVPGKYPMLIIIRIGTI